MLTKLHKRRVIFVDDPTWRIVEYLQLQRNMCQSEIIRHLLEFLQKDFGEGRLLEILQEKK